MLMVLARLVRRPGVSSLPRRSCGLCSIWIEFAIATDRDQNGHFLYPAERGPWRMDILIASLKARAYGPRSRSRSC